MTIAANILRGMGSILEISPNRKYRRNKKTDAENLASDWGHVGRDLRHAIVRVRKGHKISGFKKINHELSESMYVHITEQNKKSEELAKEVLNKLKEEFGSHNGK